MDEDEQTGTRALYYAWGCLQVAGETRPDLAAIMADALDDAARAGLPVPPVLRGKDEPRRPSRPSPDRPARIPVGMAGWPTPPPSPGWRTGS